MLEKSSPISSQKIDNSAEHTETTCQWLWHIVTYLPNKLCELFSRIGSIFSCCSKVKPEEKADLKDKKIIDKTSKTDTSIPKNVDEFLKFDEFKIASLDFDKLMNSNLDKDELFYYANDLVHVHRTLKRVPLTERLALWKKCAEMGHIEAAFLAGDLYFNGYESKDSQEKQDYIEINLSEAIIWLQKAANAGKSKACELLARIYLNDEWSFKDLKKGGEWLLLAFKNGAIKVSIPERKNRNAMIFNLTAATDYLNRKSLFDE